MSLRTGRRITAYLLSGFVAVGLVVGLASALYPFAQEAYDNIVTERAVTPLS